MHTTNQFFNEIIFIDTRKQRYQGTIWEKLVTIMLTFCEESTSV